MPSSWPPLSHLQVLSGGVAVYPPGATFGPRQLWDYEFVWIIEGGAIAHFESETVPAPPGTIILARPGLTDRYTWAERARTVHAYFHFRFQSPPPPWPAPATWPLAQTVPREDILRPLFRYVLAALTEPEPLRSALATPAAELMVRSFVAGKSSLLPQPRTELPPPVERTLEFIGEAARRHPAPAITLADLARVAHVSGEHLCRLFRQNLAMSPLQCLRLARLDRAAGLVARSNLTFKEIAEITGFANPFHFSIAFKAIYGVPPSAYRLAVTEGRPVHVSPAMKDLRLV